MSVSGRGQEELAGFVFGEGLEFLVLPARAFDAIGGVVRQRSFLNSMVEDVVEHRVDQLQGASACATLLECGVHALDVDRADILDVHFPEGGEDVVLSDLPVLEDGPFPARERFPIEPGADEAFQSNVDATVCQPAVDLGQHRLDPVVAFPLGFAVFG